MRNFFLMFLAAAFILVAGGCSPNNVKNKNELKVFNWGEYIDESVLSRFESETGIKVVYETYATNEDMYTKIKNSGNSSYDVCIPSDYMIAKMIGEDMLSKINYDNIPNYSLIDAKFKKPPYNSYDKSNGYAVPYMWGTIGILYDTELVSEEEATSWSVLWNPKFKGQIFMKDDQRDSMGIALRLLGYSVNETNESKLMQAKDKLLEQKSIILAYGGDEVKDKMIAGEAALAVMYSGDALYCMDENENLRYSIPKEGTNVWVDSMVIPKTSVNKENAEKFINFMCRTDIAEKNRDYISYSSPQAEVVKNLPEEIKENPATYPGDELSELNLEMYEDLGDKAEIFNKIWTEITAN